MDLSPETIDAMLRRLKMVDDYIDAARAAIGKQDAASAIRQTKNAMDHKHRVVDLCDDELKVVYDIFFYLDLAERSAVLFPYEDPDLNHVIEDLEQSLNDIEHLLKDPLLSDDEEQALEDIRDWLDDAIAGLKKNPPVLPKNDGFVGGRKKKYFQSGDPSGFNWGMFQSLEGIDDLLYWAMSALGEEPPDFASATKYLRNAEFLKHLLIDRLKEIRKSNGSNPQGWEDLPKLPPDYA